MRWPPNKAWTSTSLREGYRHFVAINYGGKGLKRWVILVSVLDGNARLRVSWEEMNDISIWISGWLQLSRDQASLPVNSIKQNKESISREENICLHPSHDSGLNIPSEPESIRPWFLDSNC